MEYYERAGSVLINKKGGKIMKILIGGKCAIITAAFAVILYCGCVGDGIGIAFLAEGGQFSSDAKYYSSKDQRDGKTYKLMDGYTLGMPRRMFVTVWAGGGGCRILRIGIG